MLTADTDRGQTREVQARLTCLAVSIAVPTCTGTINLGNSHQMKRMTRRCGLTTKLLHTMSSMTR